MYGKGVTAIAEKIQEIGNLEGGVEDHAQDGRATEGIRWTRIFEPLIPEGSCLMTLPAQSYNQSYRL